MTQLVGFLRSEFLSFRLSGGGGTQGGRSCATARPPVAASAEAPALAGSPSIRAFVAKSILSRFTRFWMYHFQPQHTRFCRDISFVALLGVSFSAIHGDEWLFHDYDASAGLATLAQGWQRWRRIHNASAGLPTLAQSYQR